MLIGFIIILMKNTSIMSYSSSMELIKETADRVNTFNENMVNSEYYQRKIIRNSNLVMDFIDNSLLMSAKPNSFIWNYIKNWLLQYLNNPINYSVFVLFQLLSYKMYFSLKINNPLTRKTLSFFLYLYNRTFPILSKLLFKNFR